MPEYGELPDSPLGGGGDDMSASPGQTNDSAEPPLLRLWIDRSRYTTQELSLILDSVMILVFIAVPVLIALIGAVVV